MSTMGRGQQRSGRHAASSGAGPRGRTRSGSEDAAPQPPKARKTATGSDSRGKVMRTCHMCEGVDKEYVILYSRDPSSLVSLHALRFKVNLFSVGFACKAHYLNYGFRFANLIVCAYSYS